MDILEQVMTEKIQSARFVHAPVHIACPICKTVKDSQLGIRRVLHSLFLHLRYEHNISEEIIEDSESDVIGILSTCKPFAN